MGAERQTNMHAYMHTFTLFVKQFQETRRAPTAGLGCAPGLKRNLHKLMDMTIGKTTVLVWEQKKKRL